MPKVTELSPGVGQYVKDIQNSTPLSREEEAKLAQRIRMGDGAARDKLIEANTRFVGKVAAEYFGFGLPMADLLSAGNIGLIMAAERFDESRKVKFVSYAVWWIRQAILKAIEEGGRTVRLPVNKVKEIVKLGKVKRAAAHRLGCSASDDELAAEIGWTRQKAAEISNLSVWSFSLDTPLKPDGERTVMDLIPDQGVLPDQIAEDKILWEKVEQSMQYLDERSRKVLVLYFGLGCEPLTLQKIGDQLGLVKERARQIRDDAILDLKVAILRNRNSKTRPWLKTAGAPV